MSTEPEQIDARDDDVIDYDAVAAQGPEKVPFRYKLGGAVRELQWPLASTKRAIQTAVNENRSTDVCRLVFQGDWPDVDVALDDLGPDGDDALTHLLVDYFDHIGMNEESMERFRANREERRAARKARGRFRGRSGR